MLLLVAANVANLTLARVLGRERELAVRAALGAGRGRIARQLLTESTLLAIAGGGLGLLVGWLVRDLLVAFTARFTPRAEEIAIDGTVLAFTLGVSVVTGLLFGLLPALTRAIRGRRWIDAMPAIGRPAARGSARAQRAHHRAGGHLVRAAGRRRAARAQLRSSCSRSTRGSTPIAC